LFMSTEWIIFISDAVFASALFYMNKRLNYLGENVKDQEKLTDELLKNIIAHNKLTEDLKATILDIGKLIGTKTTPK